MFYRAEDHHGLAHNPFKAIVAPRPIGWISTIAANGTVNLAPYSFFNAVGDAPMMVMFASGGVKDSAKNARETGAFTCNFVSYAARESMNISSGSVPHGVSEFELAGLSMAAGETVPCPRVRDVPAALECRVTDMMQPSTLDGGRSNYVVVFGEVTGVFIDDAYILDGRFDLAKADPIMRAGYRDYMRGGEMLELARPGE